MTRREFLTGGLAALGFAALPGNFLFAAPKGWRPDKKPNLVFGVVSDTHLRTGYGPNGKPGRNWPHKYFAAALEYFKNANVDAVVHCGDFAHRGQVEEMQFHANVWRKVFGEKGPVKLFVTGNHDKDGATYGDFVAGKYPDPVERAKHVLATDMAANWERIWGEPYSDVWHKEVRGYHFFGLNWGVEGTELANLINTSVVPCGLDKGINPFFFLSHRKPLAPLRKAIRSHRNAVSFFGHNHCSASNWNVVSLYYGGLPCIQVPSCEPRGSGAFVHDEYISTANLERKTDKSLIGMSRQGYVVSLYDDMMVIERREFGEGGSLGADWVMPFGKTPHPFLKEELKKVIGEPQFKRGTALEICNCGNVELCNYENMEMKEIQQSHNPTISQSHNLTIKIPLADGNPDSRVYAYEVAVVGDEGTPKLHKAVYAAGVNLGIGHEPNGGVTTLEIPKSELPLGKKLTVAVRPLTSLGTFGRPIIKEVVI